MRDFDELRAQIRAQPPLRLSGTAPREQEMAKLLGDDYVVPSAAVGDVVMVRGSMMTFNVLAIRGGEVELERRWTGGRVIAPVDAIYWVRERNG